MKKQNKGFTLLEMLIVVAVIAVMITIMGPVILHVREKPNEVSDCAALRAAYSTLSAALASGSLDSVSEIEKKTDADTGKDLYRIWVEAKQNEKGWVEYEDKDTTTLFGCEVQGGPGGWYVEYHPEDMTFSVSDLLSEKEDDEEAGK